MAHKHSIYDTDPHFTIDPSTRRIKNESNKVTLVQGDHNSERFTFEIPRYIDGHDMSLCDVVEIHYDNIESSTKEVYSDVEEISDLQISPDSDDVVIFSWLISGNATQYKGALNFSIGFQCHDGEGNIDYELGTLDHEGITVGGRIRNSKSVIERVADILSKWRNDLFGIGDTEEAKMLAVSKEQQAAIEAKGEAVLASIPNEFDEVVSLADENARIKAGAIVLNAEGETIKLSDASDGYLQGLKVFGKSTQEEAPTPDAPVDIISVKNPTVMFGGKNLIPETTVSFERDYYIPLCMKYPPGVYSFSAVVESTDTDADKCYVMFYADQTKLVKSYIIGRSSNGERIGFKATIPDYFDYIRFYASTGWSESSGDTATFTDIMFEFGADASEYDPYNGCSITIPHTISAIPVTTGGNRIDSDGQQWICDEIDFEREVYVQRVDKRVLTGAEYCVLNTRASEDNINVYQYYTESKKPITNAFRCSHFVNAGHWDDGLKDGTNVSWLTRSVLMFKTNGVESLEDFIAFVTEQYVNGTPVTVLFALEKPIETPLSKIELEAFRTLRSNKLVTNIFNDSNAHMSVDYVADTKTYIDNQVAKCVSNAVSELVVEHDGEGSVSLSFKETTNT